ncbi:MAG: type II toxin-antitoxin system HipA family toxin YjjJ [Polaromonas sp.]|nr:type II toxin-antitoxin system HipA family toxin YjjJ [Polaromonas sp.]
MSLTSVTQAVLQALRRRGGVASALELQADLRVSQPTVSRALAPLLQAGEVRKVGAARSQRYVLPRRVPGLGATVPIRRIDAQGQSSLFGHLTPLQSGAVWVDEVYGPKHTGKRHGGLPWFLSDMRPQGFMGRTFAAAHPALQLGANPDRWSDDEVLRALSLYGDDLPGNLVVGEAALERFHTLAQRASRVESAAQYPALADAAMQGTLPGSSAGGEQPKFCTCAAGRHVIVKFSPADDTPLAQRTRDLLVCEHLALKTLQAAGLPAAITQIVMAAGRVFLESERFDRTAQGRVGMVSLSIYDAEYIGQEDNWAATASRMEEAGLILPQDACTLRLLEAYGVLIANTDRHYGNISLLLAGDDWVLSPTYDMLPMLYAPVAGELVPRVLAVRAPQPTAATLAEWPRAVALAQAFWATVAADARVSGGFRAIAAQHLAAPP